jgi:C-terminal processing protease CtpA/Prc
MKLFNYIILIIFCSITTNCFSQTIELKKNIENYPKAETDSLLKNLCENLRETYFDEKKSKILQTLLMSKLKSGEFYNLTVDTMTKKITTILRTEANDIHFYLGYKNKDVNNNIVEKKKKYFNGGFVEVKLLEHNIGYIKWIRGVADDEAFEKIASAFTFLKGCEYLIIDVTHNPGGDGRSNGFINQHLFQYNDYQNLLLKKCKGESDWHQSEVPYNYSPAPKFFEIPLYIIVSKNTGSSAEYFAFISQEMQRATILGETTAGAGNPVTMKSFDDFFAYIPICEIKTTEGKSIEGKGVIPDVKLSSTDWVKETIDYILSKR